MATEGLRRSTRVRKQVKSYADEQAEYNAVVFDAAPPKRKRKAPVDDHDSIEIAKPAKKPTKKSKEEGDAKGEGASSIKAAKASSSKPKRTVTNKSWHESAAERRIAVNNRNVRKLAPGQQETRLRE